MISLAKQRYDYIDAVKGVAILGIVLMHFEDGVFPVLFNIWTGLFMIAAFYFTSGWITGIKDIRITPKQLFKKRLKQLGIPYLWFVLIILVFDLLLVLLDFMDIKIFFRDLYCAITLRGIGALWFLPVLLFGEWLFCVVRSCNYKYLMAVVLFAATLVSSYFYDSVWMKFRDLDDLYRIIDSPIRPLVSSLKAWPIIALGFLAGKYLGSRMQNLKKVSLLSTGVLLLAFSVWLVVRPAFHIYYLNDILSRTVPTLGLIVLFMVVKPKLIVDFFTYWGCNSLVLLGTHYSITLVIFKLFDSNVLHHSLFSGPVTLLYFVLAILVTYPMVALFNGRLKFMLGKK